MAVQTLNISDSANEFVGKLNSNFNEVADQSATIQSLSVNDGADTFTQKLNGNFGELTGEMEVVSTTDDADTFVEKLNNNFENAGQEQPTPTYTDVDYVARFIAEMNTKAALMGMSNTHFVEPAGNQPSDYNSPQSYPELFLVYDRNIMSIRDALKELVYANGIQAITNAWNYPSFTLSFNRNGNATSTTITSTVYNNTTYQSTINSLLQDYDILGGKTGSTASRTINNKTYYGGQCLLMIVRHKASERIFASAYIAAWTSVSQPTINKWGDSKAGLDYVVNGGNFPSLSTNANRYHVIAELTSNSNSTNIIYQNVPSGASVDDKLIPASLTKVVTAILLAENVQNLNFQVKIKECDRQPPTGYAFIANDELYMNDVLKCLMVQSSNTSALVIARVVGEILLEKDNIK